MKLAKKQMIWIMINSMMLGFIYVNFFAKGKLTVVDYIVLIILSLSVSIQYFLKYFSSGKEGEKTNG